MRFLGLAMDTGARWTKKTTSRITATRTISMRTGRFKLIRSHIHHKGLRKEGAEKIVRYVKKTGPR